MMGRELSLPEGHGHSMSWDSSGTPSPWDRPAGTTWFGLGCGQDGDEDPGHRLWMRDSGPPLLLAHGSRGELALSARWEERISVRRALQELHPTTVPQTPAQLHLPGTSFYSFHKGFCKGKNRRGGGKPTCSGRPSTSWSCLCAWLKAVTSDNPTSFLFTCFPLSASQLELYLAEHVAIIHYFGGVCSFT